MVCRPVVMSAIPKEYRLVLIVAGLIVVENGLVANDGPLLNMAFSVLALVHYFLRWYLISWFGNLSVTGISSVLSSL